MKHVKTNLYVTPKGVTRGIREYYIRADSDEDAIEHVVNRTDYHYTCGRKVYVANEDARAAFDAGDYTIADLLGD